MNLVDKKVICQINEHMPKHKYDSTGPTHFPHRLPARCNPCGERIKIILSVRL